MLTRLILGIRRRIPNPLIGILLVTGFFSNAQQPAFDQVYDKIWKESANTNLDAAVASADSLYRSSSTSTHRLRCLMLIARLYQQKEQLDKSVEYALKVEQLADESADYAWQARANGYLAGLYRMMELYGKARNYSSKALEIVPKITDHAQANSTRGLLLQELGFTSMDEKDYKQAITHFQEAGKSILLIEKNREFNIMNNERLLADNYRLLARYDTALVHYHKALSLSPSAPLHYVTGLIYKGLAETLMEKGNLTEAKKYLDKAERFADESEYLQLKDATYELSKRYYSLTKDRQKLTTAKEKSISITDTLLDKRTQLLNRMYTQLERDGQKAETISNTKNAAIMASILLILSGSVFFMLYQRKQKRELTQVRNILARLNTKEILGPDHQPPTDAVSMPPFNESFHNNGTEKDQAESSDENTEKRMMPIETERHLLEKLVEFEKSNTFLENGFSLASLSAQLDTNTKYLSYLVKKYKKTDFNNYINRLRIDFVIDMLKNDPVWRQHKISTLATASGFSSHSQFAAVFKDFTGVTPSVFIRHINSEQQ
ncbi:helix-turn-helix domain-containing protein [Dyadobacter sp. OTU695]|uniref:helix-turn-helix domain-containing protein n=1 Tax=Dyadobacter sp. OTU695 TaxID=3043860 RepID=UPI00313ECD64